MRHFDCKIFLFLLLLPACKKEQTDDSQLVVTAKMISARIEPSEKSPEIAILQKGQFLKDLGEVSPFESQIAYDSDVFQTPWLKVQTPEGQTGWVLAWAVMPVKKREDWLLQKRLICYFGKALTARRNALCSSLSNLQTEDQMATIWGEADALRDTFLLQLARRPEAGYQLQFNWIEEALPGFLFQKIGEGERPFLFADYRVWQQKAMTTSGLQDDVFFNNCISAFPNDSIESFFPVWKFQLSDNESASQLGTGQHLKMLQLLDQVLFPPGLFASHYETFKHQILEDVFEKNVRYWQSREKVLEELAQIITYSPKCLNATELEALQIRQKMFEDPERNGILVNLRSGE